MPVSWARCTFATCTLMSWVSVCKHAWLVSEVFVCNTHTPQARHLLAQHSHTHLYRRQTVVETLCTKLSWFLPFTNVISAMLLTIHSQTNVSQYSSHTVLTWSVLFWIVRILYSECQIYPVKLLWSLVGFHLEYWELATKQIVIYFYTK